MAGARSNLFDSFFDDIETPVYTELHPVHMFPINTVPERTLTSEPQRPTADDLNYGDDFPVEASSYSESNHENSVQQPYGVTDEDYGPDDDERGVQSSDESSDGEEFPELLADSDPEQERESEDEVDDSSESSIRLPSSSNVVMGKNGMVWSKEPMPQVGRTPTRNVFRPLKSRVRSPKSIFSVCSAFFLIFTEQILNFIVKMTNLEGVRVKGRFWKQTDLIEMKALIGLFIHFGARKLNLVKIKNIWYGASADNVGICTMSIRRFAELTSIIRFDDKATRSARRARDIFAPLRKVFDDINRNLQRVYLPSNSLTVDEQLVPWRGRAKFLQYLPSKPDKYGLKLFLICDSETAYPLQAIPYLGKHGERKRNLGRETVMELAAPYAKTGRNVTCDNFFTDLELAEWLSKNGLSLVGTVRKNKAFLPIVSKGYWNRQV